MCYNSVREISVLPALNFKAGTASVAHSSDLNMEVQKWARKILWDCHMHSSFSADSETPMEDMIQTAVDKGLTGICFTEHL